MTSWWWCAFIRITSMAATSDMTDELRGVTVPQADEQMLLERHKKEKKELRGVDILVVDGLHVNSVICPIGCIENKNLQLLYGNCVLGMGRDGTGWFLKIHVPNFWNARTVTEIPPCLNQVTESGTCIKSRITENLSSGMNKIVHIDKHSLWMNRRTLPSYPGLLAPLFISLAVRPVFALLGGYTWKGGLSFFWFKSAR